MSKDRQRNFKRKLKARLKRMNDSFVDKVNEVRHPAVYKLNKAKEMQDIYRNTKTKDKSIFLNLDGTIGPYRPLKRSHHIFRFRPYFAEFAAELMKFADLYLYTLSDPYRIKRLWKEHFEQWFVGCFDKRFLFAGKKS